MGQPPGKTWDFVTKAASGLKSKITQEVEAEADAEAEAEAEARKVGDYVTLDLGYY